MNDKTYDVIIKSFFKVLKFFTSILIILGLDCLKCVSLRDRDKHLIKIITKLTTVGARSSLDDKIGFTELMFKPVGWYGIPFKLSVGPEKNCEEETLLEKNFCFGECSSDNKNISMCLPDKYYD